MIPAGTVPAGRGLVELRVKWPARQVERARDVGRPPSANAPTGAPGESRGLASFGLDSGFRRNDDAYRAQLLPDSSERVLFEVSAASVVVASASVARAEGASTSTARLELDAGAYLLAASAYSRGTADEVAVATASAALVVIGGAKVPVGLTLAPAYVPAVAKVSATSIYPGGSLTFDGSNLVLSWAATPSVEFTGAGASVSAVVTAVAEGSITVTVPQTAVSGSVRIVTDGVPAELVAVTIAPTPAPTPAPTAAPTATPTAAPTASPPAGFVAIAAGSFEMGSPAGPSPPAELGRDSGETQHAVTLTHPFWLGETEVTQGQWKAAFAGTNPSSFTGDDNRPVEMVTWWSALEYANALSTAQSLAACYTATGCSNTAGAGTLTGCTGLTVNATNEDPYLCEGYRLPTESEWEYGYRAGTTTAYYNGTNTSTTDDPNLYPIAWFYYNSDTGSGRQTHAAKGKTPNAWGLYDMAGNVWEWNWDWYNATYPGTVTDPLGATSGSYRVYRGGSWGSHAQDARAAYRRNTAPDTRGNRLGVRLARSRP